MPRGKCTITILISIVLTMGYFLPARGTTIQRFSFTRLGQSAPVIVVARCITQTTEQDPGTRSIYTRSTFSVQEVLKGHADATITLRMPGGQFEGRRSMMHGVPDFHPGDEAVLFLTQQDTRGFPWVMGLSQGCFRIFRDPQSGTALVRYAVSDTELVDPTTGRVLQKPATPPPPELLETFKQRLSRILDHRPETPAGKDRP